VTLNKTLRRSLNSSGLVTESAHWEILEVCWGSKGHVTAIGYSV
jgi:hypothetical protein